MPINRGMRSRQTSRIPTTITIPSSLVISSGTSPQTLTAVVRDQTGAVMATPPDAWQSSDPGIITAVVPGTVTYIAVGTANITASLTTSGVTITSNTCAATATSGSFAAPDILDVNFATATVSGGVITGSVGTLTNPFFGSQNFAVPSDPTGGGFGKVLQMDYNPVAFSNDFYVFVSLPTPLGYGARLCVRGLVYYLATAHPDDNRKTIGIFSNALGGGGAAVDLEIHKVLEGPPFNAPGFRYHVRDVPGGVSTDHDGSMTINPVHDGQWYTIEMEILCNSVDGATDGFLKVYLNGGVSPSFTLTGLSPISDTGGSVRLTSVRFGTQCSNVLGTSYIDTRYFQRCAVSTQRIGP